MSSADDKLVAQELLRDFARPAVTVDLVVLTVVDTDLKVLLVERSGPPFHGQFALPGGFVRAGDVFEDQGESLSDAAHRELAEKTGLPVGSVFLEQLYTFGTANRDPRLRAISVANYALVRPDLMAMVVAGKGVQTAAWFSVAEALEEIDLAFDHKDIMTLAVQRIRGKIDYSPIAFELVPQTFTTAELRQVFEAIKGTSYDVRNFRRRFQRMVADGIILQAPGKRQTQTKPAKVYSFAKG